LPQAPFAPLPPPPCVVAPPPALTPPKSSNPPVRPHPVESPIPTASATAHPANIEAKVGRNIGRAAYPGGPSSGEAAREKPSSVDKSEAPARQVEDPGQPAPCTVSAPASTASEHRNDAIEAG
jgi:hypothetical protein